MFCFSGSDSVSTSYQCSDNHQPLTALAVAHACKSTSGGSDLIDFIYFSSLVTVYVSVLLLLATGGMNELDRIASQERGKTRF